MDKQLDTENKVYEIVRWKLDKSVNRFHASTLLMREPLQYASENWGAAL